MVTECEQLRSGTKLQCDRKHVWGLPVISPLRVVSCTTTIPELFQSAIVRDKHEQPLCVAGFLHHDGATCNDGATLERAQAFRLLLGRVVSREV